MQEGDVNQPAARRIPRRLLLGAGLALGAGAAAGFACAPQVPPLPPSDADSGAVTYRTSDGVQIVAQFTPPPTAAPPWPAVVLLHQYQGARVQWDTLTPHLLAAGLAVLAPDLRAHGESLRRIGPDGQTDYVTDRAGTLNGWLLDAAASLTWLAAHTRVDANRLGVGGASAGANAAWVASGALPAVRRTVALSIHFEPGGPLMGEGLPDFQPHGVLFQSDASETLQAQALYGRTQPPRRVTAYQTTGHGVELLTHPPARQDFVTWLAEGL